MVIKTYEAPHSIICNLTVFIGGRPRRVTFAPVSKFMGSKTGNGSMFETSDEELQNALEGSPMFGKTFNLFKEERYEEPEPESVEAPALETDEPNEEQSETIELQKMKMQSPAEAREYLVENFGYNPRSLNKVERIKKVGLEHGIEFEF